MPEFLKKTCESNCGQVQTIPRLTVTASCLSATGTGESGVPAAGGEQRANYPLSDPLRSQNIGRLCPSHVGALQQSIRNQPEHHRMESYQAEFRRLLTAWSAPMWMMDRQDDGCSPPR